MREWLAPLLFACACAEASSGGGAGTDANNSQRFDGGTQQFFDAPSGSRDASVGGGADAAQQITLNEAANTTVASSGTINCNNEINTGDNQWYRAYQLSDYPAITGGLHISSVMYGIEESASAPTVTITIGTYTGNLDGTTINGGTVIATATDTPADTTQTVETVPISADIPAGGKFVVEIDAPEDDAGYFIVGSTTGMQTHDGYWGSAVDCTQTPETTTKAGGTGSLIIAVEGTH